MREHGTAARYARGCRCQPCKDARATLARRYRNVVPRVTKEQLAELAKQYAVTERFIRDLGGRRFVNMTHEQRESICATARNWGHRLKCGTEYGYRMGCRCEPCSEALRVASLARYHRSKHLWPRAIKFTRVEFKRPIQEVPMIAHNLPCDCINGIQIKRIFGRLTAVICECKKRKTA